MWWALDGERFIREQDEVAAITSDWLVKTDWKMDALTLKLDFDFKVGERIYEAVLVYPALFPETAAYVMPRSAGEYWSEHQYGGSDRVLCLQWGPDNWRTDVTGAMLIQSSYDLIAGEAGVGGEPKVVPSRHSLTVGQRTRNAKWRLVTTAGSRAAIDSLPDGAQRSAKFVSSVHSDEWIHFCTELKDGETTTFTDVSLPEALKSPGLLRVWEDDGWVFKSSAFYLTKEAENPDKVLAQIQAAGYKDFTWPVTTEESISYVVTLAKSSTEMLSYSILFTKEKSLAVTLTHIDAGASHANRVPADQAHWSGKTIGLVGLGSVGTKVAKSLVRQGVRKLVLIEDDVMLPENVERNDLDWLSVGVSKAEALKQALSLIAADVEVKLQTYRVAGQENARLASTTLDILGKCDLIIDATANPKVFTYLAAVASRYKKTLVWGEVFAGGIGSLMARSRPDVDPSPLSTRLQIHNYLEDKPKAPFQTAEGYDTESEVGTPLVASDGEVGQFASALTRFAIDSMREPANQEFPYSAYLMGFKTAWIFSAPFDTRPIQTSIVPELEPQMKPADEATKNRWLDTLKRLITANVDVKDTA